MATPETERLDREIDIFCRYLIGRPPDEFVSIRYRRAHEAGALHLGEPRSRMDRLMVRIACISPTLTRMADAYTSVCPGNVLRNKLVLSLGILENSPAHHKCFKTPPQSSRVAFLMRACGMAAVYVANVLAGMLVFLPLRLVLWLFESHRSSSS